MNNENTIEKPSYFAIIPANVRYDKELKANAKLLYGEISCLCNSNGQCWATNNYFAELYGVSKETVSRWISQLAKKNYIKVVITYQESGEIDKRYISILSTLPIDEKINTSLQKNQEGIDEKINRGIDKKVKGNNTSNINNTSNNNKENIKESERDFDYDEVVKKIINIFPGTKTKSVRDKKLPKILKKYGVEEVIKATTRYANEVKDRDKNYIMQESTFWNTRYIDYLTENYEEESQQPTTPKRTYTTNVTNKAAKEATSFYDAKSDYVPDYKKNYDAKSHNPKGHDNFEISSDMQKFTTNENFANDMERKLLGWDDYDESENPYMN